MARLPGPKKVKKNLAIRQSLADQVDVMLAEPTTVRVPVGAWSSLVERLLIAHMRENQRAGHLALTSLLKNPTPFPTESGE